MVLRGCCKHSSPKFPVGIRAVVFRIVSNVLTMDTIHIYGLANRLGSLISFVVGYTSQLATFQFAVAILVVVVVAYTCDDVDSRFTWWCFKSDGLSSYLCTGSGQRPAKVTFVN